jgi:hypothetical protein
MTILDFLLERVAEADPELDLTSASFKESFTDPVTSYFGLDLPTTDILAIERARLTEEFPDLDGSVLSDAVGRIAALIFIVCNAELEASKSRRRLDDRRLLSGADMEEMRDTFFVDAEGGRFASGRMRVYFPTPRNIVLDGATRIIVPAGGGLSDRSYRPTTFYNFTASFMRNQQEGTRYYVDIDVVAGTSGSDHDLDVGEARGSTGIPGAILITNPDRIEGGQDEDDVDTYLSRIQASNRTRTGSTFGGLDYLLRTLGLSRFYVAQTGDPLLTRDRIYGPAFISGVLGGFKRDYSSADAVLTNGQWASLGIAYDVWITTSDETQQQISTVRISNLRDEGLIILSGDMGYIEHSSGTPVATDPVTTLAMPANHKVLVSRSKSLGLVVNDPLLYRRPFTRYTFSMFPIEVGDVLEREGWVDPFAGIRSRGTIRSLGDAILTGGRKVSVELDDAADPYITIVEESFRFQILRVNSNWWEATRGKFAASILPHTSCPCFAIPVVGRRAVDPLGELLKVGEFPALTKPGTTAAEVVAGAYVPRTRNILEQETPLPLSWLSRCEIMDPLNNQARATGLRSYIYPAEPLFVEFLEARHSADATTGSTPVRVRFHLLGPQAAAPSPACSIGIDGIAADVNPATYPGYSSEGSGTEYVGSYAGSPVVGLNSWRRYGPYRPLAWPRTTYTATPEDPVAETDRLVLGTAIPDYATSNLVDLISQIVYDSSGPRVPKVGDWVLMIPTGGTYAWTAATITDTAAWPNPYITDPNYGDLIYPNNEWYKVARAFPIKEIKDGITIIIEAPDVPVGETGYLWIVQGTSRREQLSAGRGSEGTYNFDVFCARLDHSGSDPSVVEHPPYNTPVQFDPLEMYIQGFHQYSSRPSLFFSADDNTTLLFPTGYVNDGEELDGRTIQAYGPTGSSVADIQTAIDDDSVRPMTATGLVKQMPPVRVVSTFHYENDALAPKDAAMAIVAQFRIGQAAANLDPSDLVDALREAGATYVSTGRTFVQEQDHIRGFSRSASRGTTQVTVIGDLIPDAIVCRQLDSRKKALALAAGEDFVDEDSSNWIEEYIYRYGDYLED